MPPPPNPAPCWSRTASGLTPLTLAPTLKAGPLGQARCLASATSVGLLGALLGGSHPVVLAYGRFLQLYDRLETRLESELDHAHGQRLGPALMVFHVHLAVRNWLVCQLDVGETEYLPPPDFCQGLNMLEVQNNLMWLTTVTNVPALLALRLVTRASASTSNSGNRTPALGTADSAPGGAVTSATPRRDAGAQIRNPNRDTRFVGNTPLARIVRSRSVGLTINTSGSDPP
jgi:hypothetical protein